MLKTILDWSVGVTLLIVLVFLLFLLYGFQKLTLPIRDLKIKKLGMKYCRTCLGTGLIPFDLYGDDDILCYKCKGTGTRDWVQVVVDGG
jgi:hypothetical protein